MPQKLKPCPFCNGTPKLSRITNTEAPKGFFYSISCTKKNNCGVWPNLVGESKALLIARWNCRADLRDCRDVIERCPFTGELPDISRLPASPPEIKHSFWAIQSSETEAFGNTRRETIQKWNSRVPTHCPHGILMGDNCDICNHIIAGLRKNLGL